jgi:hypothetical protein
MSALESSGVAFFLTRQRRLRIVRLSKGLVSGV